jgi:transforming growth factor-beta-induced protein
MIGTSLVLSSLLASGVLVASGQSAPATPTQAQPAGAKTIPATAIAAGNFTTLVKALQAAELVDALSAEGPFTVFAPTDEAFAKVPAATLESLLKPENRDQLVAVLTYHVVPGRVMAADAVKLPNATTLNGQRFDIAVRDGKAFAGDAEIVRTDILCSNGVIHVIDEVILPQLNPIPEVAAEAGTFKTLLAAVEAAGLAPVLLGKGPFTVMAPTDEAFAKLQAGTVESLLKPENRAKLVEILTYHVIPGRVYSDEVVKLTEAPTVLGRPIPIKVKDGKVNAGGALVIATDIPAGNGVIHVIDTVMMPPPAAAQAKPAAPARRSY